jgi:hypothetical protein
MSITMQGAWTVSVKSKSAAFPQRFVIHGSANGADGIYDGVTGTPPVFVTGAQWSITIQHNPTGPTPWTPSAERLTTPHLAGGQVVFDILSNDTGGDQDYNDLILTCSAPATSSDYVIYGKARTYSGWCLFNPCFPYWYVIDSPGHLIDLLKYDSVRNVLQKLYPERILPYLEKPQLVKPPIPEPDPAPFRPLMIPTGAVPDESNVTLQIKRSEKAVEALQVARPLQTARAELGSAVLADVSPHIRDLAKLKDIFACHVEDQPGLLLRFLEYDRTADELAGGPYSGLGDRQVRGLTVTDELGNYIFHFTWELGDVAAEFGDVDTGATPLATQLRPDVIVQVISGTGTGSGILYESALYSNIPNLKRIDLCMPAGAINPGPACQGGRAIQAIGNIWTLSGVGNTFDGDGRITATNLSGPQITCGAWAGTLDLFACFLDHPEVKYYTIRFRRPGGAWDFVREPYYHIKIADIGTPGYRGTLVGPHNVSLAVDGGAAAPTPAYDNIESDPAWILTHRNRKAQLSSALYASATNPSGEPFGSVEFWIEGYNSAGVKVAAANDVVRLYIDNRRITGRIDNIAMGAVAPGECAHFTLPSNTTPLTMRFKVDQPGGFLSEYHAAVRRGHNTPVPVTSTTAPISMSFTAAPVPCAFRGTLNVTGADPDGYISAELHPGGSGWLPDCQNFCAFEFSISGTPRATNGYDLYSGYQLDIDLVGITYDWPHPPCP